MQQWVQHYEETGQLESLERCVTRVDVACLDLHQILTLAQHAGLYSAYLYVHTRALSDYVSPLVGNIVFSIDPFAMLMLLFFYFSRRT